MCMRHSLPYSFHVGANTYALTCGQVSSEVGQVLKLICKHPSQLCRCRPPSNIHKVVWVRDRNRSHALHRRTCHSKQNKCLP